MINIDGDFLLIDKPYTWTSFQVVKRLKYLIGKQYHIKKFKIGHAGTLDPLATGLLIVCIGKFTKKIEQFQASEKEYTGTFILGATTASYDREKPVNETFPFAHITQEQIYSLAKAMTGELEQVPPIFSAVKVNGKRAYKLARAESDVALQPKKITISEFEITNIALPQVDFRIVCSKGTYIRSIARDFGTELNSGAYLAALRRTRIGDFTIEKATTMDDIEQNLNAPADSI
ncbi:MAG: tRNA pseudouridine(55) synthase TruB [Bacteroidales bacterium]|jgi:tRNA pseudouridine55 synthase|nr:tRNA pseudouridine(55) synthase TruB [Bacteroidales bacterium]